MSIFSNTKQERVKGWLPFTFVGNIMLTLLFLEGLSLGGYTLIEISHLLASVTMIATCFLTGAHLPLFVSSKSILWIFSITVAAIATILTVAYVEHTQIPLSCGLIAAFSFGVVVSLRKRCWFTHAHHE